MTATANLSSILIIFCFCSSQCTLANINDKICDGKQSELGVQCNNQSLIDASQLSKKENSLSLVSLADIFRLLSPNSSLSLSDVSNNITKIEEKFIDISSKLKFNLEPVQDRLKFASTKFLLSLKLSRQCLQSVIQVLASMQQGQFWPLNFLDATGKMPSGLAEGVTTSLGDYDQCLNIASPLYPSNSAIEPIRGKYCLVRPFVPFSLLSHLDGITGFEFLDDATNAMIMKDWKKNLNLLKVLLTYNVISEDKFYLFHHGVCIPAKCTENDLKNVFNKVIGPIAPIPIEVSKCDTISDIQVLTNYQLALIIISSLFLALSVTCTILSLTKFTHCKLRDGYPLKLLQSFSAFSANKRLFTVSTDRLLIADGLLFAYLVWDSMRYQYGSIVASGFLGFNNIRSSFIVRVIEESKYFWLRSYMPRDSIFTICGAIIAYDFFGPKQRPITLKQYAKFVIEKYLRFLPKTLGPMLVLNLLTVNGSGPLWQGMSDCSDKPYWKNLLFITNLGDSPSQNCQSLSWLLSCIFQYHVISPLFMIPFKIAPRFGYTFNLLLLPITCFVSIAPKLVHNYKLIPYEVSQAHSIQEMKQSFFRFYYHPDQYLSLFILGIIVGYAMRNTKPIDLFLKKRITRLFVATLCYVSSLLGIIWSENFKDMNEPQNEINLNLWFSCNKLFWMIGNVWIIYDVHTSKHGLTKGILSAPILAALSRISLVMFVLNSISFHWRIFTKRQVVEISHTNQLQFFYVDMSIMLTLAYLIYVIVEHPVINLIEIIKNRRNANVHANVMRVDKSTTVELDYVFSE